MQYKNEHDPFILKKTPIPDIFYSDDTGQPMKTCVMCDRSLLEPGVIYLIEKAFTYNRKFNVRDTIFEYAICLNCNQKITVHISNESQSRIQEYFCTNSHFTFRSEYLLKKETLNLQDWIGRCCIKGTQWNDMAEFQIYGQFEGEHMMLSHLPIMLGDTALDELNNLLSEKTREEMDRFRDQFLGLPPELRNLLKERSSVLV
ncbi:MAG: hypothetical protein KatS3mg031_1482 [Chitinophagales bacterium]|nr:MAG: hypothetical protein KatS3mg031_1482 [Chitinophagales bacterium]